MLTLQLPRPLFPLLAMASLLCGCCGPRTDDEMSEGEGAVQRVQGFSLVETDGGQRVWKLDAATGTYLENDSLLVLAEVDMTFFEEDVPDAYLVGDSGKVRTATGSMRVWGNVHVETVDGRELEAPELFWNEDGGFFESDCTVVLTVPDSLGQTVMTGRGVRLTTALEAGKDVDVREAFQVVYTGSEPPEGVEDAL
ncbi:MAG: LPS export ABC transporter periplasmic protein LptC [Candidatus Fermentibacteraceae bacterium]